VISFIFILLFGVIISSIIVELVEIFSFEEEWGFLVLKLISFDPLSFSSSL